MPANPRGSIVVTCYNLGRFLPEAIDSVRRQTFSDFEIVVVDDGTVRVSHEPRTVFAFCGGALLIDAGRIVAEGSAGSVATAYTRLLSEGPVR